MSELAYLSVAQAGRLIRSRELSPVALTEALLERIAALDPVYHAFIAVTAEIARAAAKAAETEIAARPVARADARRALRAQGHLRRRRPAHHLPLQAAHRPPRDARTPPWSGGCARPARSCSASCRCTNSPMAGRPWSCPGRPPATRGTSTCIPAGRRADAEPRPRPAWRPRRSAPTPADRCAIPRPVAA